MNLEKQIQTLGELYEMDSRQLRQKWLETFGRKAENAYSLNYMRKHLADAERIKCEDKLETTTSRRKYAPQPGKTRTRRYKGEDHIVRKVENGFEYRGELYNSYSAITRLITGHKQSRLAFFQVSRDGQRLPDENSLVRCGGARRGPSRSLKRSSHRSITLHKGVKTC